MGYPELGWGNWETMYGGGMVHMIGIAGECHTHYLLIYDLFSET